MLKKLNLNQQKQYLLMGHLSTKYLAEVSNNLGVIFVLNMFSMESKPLHILRKTTPTLVLFMENLKG